MMPHRFRPNLKQQPPSASDQLSLDEEIGEFLKRLADLNGPPGPEENKIAFSRIKRAFMHEDANRDGLIVDDSERDRRDALVHYAMPYASASWLRDREPEDSEPSSAAKPFMFLSDEQLMEVFRKFSGEQKVLFRKDLKKAFNHFGLFFPEYAENVLDPNRTGCVEIKQLDDLVMHADRFGYAVY